MFVFKSNAVRNLLDASYSAIYESEQWARSVKLLESSVCRRSLLSLRRVDYRRRPEDLLTVDTGIWLLLTRLAKMIYRSAHSVDQPVTRAGHDGL